MLENQLLNLQRVDVACTHNMKQVPSPNFSKGRSGYKPEMIVIHIMEGSLSGTDGWFQNPASKVSAHYGVGLNADVHQYVQESDVAWHAGRVDKPTAKLKAGLNPNLYTIGIEHEGKATSIWSEEMKQASASLIKDICTRNNIPLDRQHIVGHREIYSKKTCPGDLKIIDELILLAKGVNDNILLKEATLQELITELQKFAK